MGELLEMWDKLEAELETMQPEQLLKLGLIVDESSPVDQAALDKEVADFEQRWQAREARLAAMKSAVKDLKSRLAQLEKLQF